MRITFLDIDGVLNNDATFFVRNPRLDCIGQECMDFFLDTISAIPEHKVVISSSWRLDSLEHFKRHVEGIDHKRQIQRVYPFLHEDYCTRRLDNHRGREVREWLSRHPEVDRYICLDDSVDYFSSQPLLQTNRYYGFGFTEQLIMWEYFGVKSIDDRDYGIGHVESRMKHERSVQRRRSKILKLIRGYDDGKSVCAE